MPVMRLLLFALLAALILAPRASAHALGAECKLVGDRVELAAYFDDDTAARDARVRVEDAGKQVVAEGRTDPAGRWTFPRPGPGRYAVVVDAGDGHRTVLTVTIPGAATPATTIIEGPTRQEFTSTQWLKLGLGVAVIGGLSAAFLVSRRRGRSAR